ncbi:MAG: hypothetical protein QOK25_322 [Thermoleophilaceae bacterium]|nr:hypothetical protein [Thermoleophilaceae bacterium]
MHPRRLVLLVRLAVYGTVLLLALGVYFLSLGHDAPAVASPGRQMTGNTSQGLTRVWAVNNGGHIDGVHIVWKLRCTNGATWPAPLGVAFHDPADRFRRDGRTFSVSSEFAYAPKGGWIAYAIVRADGMLHADGRSAHGQSASVVKWISATTGRTGATCSSGPVSWKTRG